MSHPAGLWSERHRCRTLTWPYVIGLRDDTALLPPLEQTYTECARPATLPRWPPPKTEDNWQCRFQTHNLIMHNACTALLPSLEETYTECTRPATLPVAHQKMHNLLFIPNTIVVSKDISVMTHTPAATNVFRPSHETDVAFDPWLKNAPSQTFSLDFHTKTSRKRLKKPHFMVVLPLLGWAQDKAVGGGESSQAFSISTMTMKGSCSNHAKGSEHIFNLLRATNELQKVWNPPLSTWWSQRQKIHMFSRAEGKQKIRKTSGYRVCDVLDYVHVHTYLQKLDVSGTVEGVEIELPNNIKKT